MEIETVASQKGGYMRHNEDSSEQVRHKCFCYTVIGAVMFILCLWLPFACDRAHAEPQRLTTEDQRTQMAAKKKAKADNMPDVQAFEDAVDNAFPDNKQAAVIKKLARVLHIYASDGKN